MATTTPRIGLTKPDLTDLVDIGVLNTNFDKIDSNIASTKIQATKPTTANSGDLWWDSDTGTLYVYYVGASSSSWVAATSDPINIGVVANQTERDAQYPTPAQGMSVWRQDLGAQETYYGLYNSSTNPGGRDSAGWYTTDRLGGLIPVKPTAVTFVSGTGSVSSIGKVSFTNCASVGLDNVIVPSSNKYRLVVTLTSTSTTTNVGIRGRQGSTDFTGLNYFTVGESFRRDGSISDFRTEGNAGLVGAANGGLLSSVDIANAGIADATFLHWHCQGTNAAQIATIVGGVTIANSQVFDGITILATAGTFTGTVEIFKYLEA